jgi:hypothetical protein
MSKRSNEHSAEAEGEEPEVLEVVAAEEEEGVTAVDGEEGRNVEVRADEVGQEEGADRGVEADRQAGDLVRRSRRFPRRQKFRRGERAGWSRYTKGSEDVPRMKMNRGPAEDGRQNDPANLGNCVYNQNSDLHNAFPS